MGMEKGVQRWIVDISKWDPSPQDFSMALSVLPLHEHSSITSILDIWASEELPNVYLRMHEFSRNFTFGRFIRMEDRKRALVSRLLQYTLAHEVLEIPYDDIVIKRTLEGKPYLECDTIGLEFPNFNFNASHHGDYVAIASEPLCLVGLDIVSYDIPQKETIPEFIQNFSSYFSRLEWGNIMNAGTCDEILIEFYRYWCLKEAYVKATGSGLAYELDKVEFLHTNWTNIRIRIDGKPMMEWRFWFFELGNRHCASIARGHPRSAVESYKRTLKRAEFDEEEYHVGLHLPNVCFASRTVEQLIPVLSRAVNSAPMRK